MVIDFPEREIHGGTGKRQRENTRKNVLDFSASINPFPPVFAWNVDPEDLRQYPDDGYCELKNLIAQTFHRAAEEICVGNGSIELIRVFCSIMLKKNKKFFAEPHTFGEYSLSARLAGAERTGIFRESDVSFICNPNNPTGNLRTREEMIGWLEDASSHDGQLFCDEAFIELSDPAQSLIGVSDPHLFVLHSLTKSFSVPGIRFGYGFGDPDLIEKIEITRPPWSVNAFAEAFASQAFRRWNELEKSRTAIEIERKQLTDGICALGLHCCPSSANFILVEYGRDVPSLCNCLIHRNILVRNCASFGLPAYIRVAVRTRAENKILLEGLSECLP